MVHLIFVTKYRKRLFYGAFREDVKQLLFEACVKHHWNIKRMETDKDHVHILLQYNPTDSVTKIVSLLKQYSTYYVWKKYPAMLKTLLERTHLMVRRILRCFHRNCIAIRYRTLYRTPGIVKSPLKGRCFFLKLCEKMAFSTISATAGSCLSISSFSVSAIKFSSSV